MEVFRQAQNRFHSALSAEEKAQYRPCDSVEKLLADVRQFSLLPKGNRRLSDCMLKIEAFTDNLEPYLGVIAIICGSHAGRADTTFGILRLVLQMASSYGSFFEKLCDALERLDARFPRYQELYDKLSSQKVGPVGSTLTNALGNTYDLLFEFFQSVAGLFSRPSGRRRHTFSTVASLARKPFDVRFKEILEKISFYHNLVKEEIETERVDEMQDDLSKLKAAAAEQATEKLQITVLEKLKEIQEGQAPNKAQLALLQSLLIDGFSRQATLESQNRLLDLLYQFRKHEEAQMQAEFKTAVIRWIDPPDYKENLCDAQDERADETAEWIFDNPALGPQDKILRQHRILPARFYGSMVIIKLNDASFKSKTDNIKGKPGSGKTVLAGSIVEELRRKQKSHTVDSAVCYYFFNQNMGKKNNHIDTYRAILAQLFYHCHEIDQVYDVFGMIKVGIVSDIRASEHELIDTIQLCLKEVPRSHFILDGIDECSNDTKLLKNIKIWCETTSVKIILLSRPDVSSLRKAISPASTITMIDSALGRDICRYLTPEFDVFRNEGLLPKDADIEMLASHLGKRAEGMFLWARVMIEYLASPALSKRQRLEIIMEDTPGGLDRLEDLYCRIQDRIDALDRPSRQLAQKALVWIAHTRLTLPELSEAITDEDLGPDRDEGSDHFEHAVIVSCRGIIEKRSNGIFRYIHLTAREFAQNGPRRSARQALIPHVHIAKAQIVQYCVRYFKKRIPANPLSGQLGVTADANIIIHRWPLLKFASRNWMAFAVELLCSHEAEFSGNQMEGLYTEINAFLQNQFFVMVWIEALYTLCPSEVYTSVEETRTNIEQMQLMQLAPNWQECWQNLKELIQDICQLNLDWGETLTETPYEVWGDVGIFQKSKFLASTKAGTVESLALRLHQKGSSSAAGPLFSQSRSSLDTKRLAVLSVFPCSDMANCRFFRDGWDRHDDIPFNAEASRRLKESYGYSAPSPRKRPANPSPPSSQFDFWVACSGWVITYEIFSIEAAESSRLLLIEAPIDALSVEICLRQSLLVDTKDWICAFALSIGPSLDRFTVLNVLFDVRSDQTYHCRTIEWPQRHRPSCWDTSKRIKSNAYSSGRDSYNYHFSWSWDGRYVLFRDRNLKASEWVQRGTSLAIFSIEESISDAEGIRLVNSFSTSSLTTGFHSCHFHPTKDLLLLRDDRDFYLWKFLDEKEPSVLQLTDTETRPGLGIESISFSSCGKYIAISYRTQPWPKLYPLETFLGIEKTFETFHEATETSSGIIENSAAQPSAASSEVAARNKQTELTTNSIISGATSSSVVVRKSHGNEFEMALLKVAPKEVQFRQMHEGKDTSTALIKLPQSIPTKNITAEVTAPIAGEDPKFQVILNAGPAKVFLSSDAGAAATHLPLVVRKDPRALRLQPSDQSTGEVAKISPIDRGADAIPEQLLEAPENNSSEPGAKKPLEAQSPQAAAGKLKPAKRKGKLNSWITKRMKK
ncbi:unnamed protein product [Clonostachys byssicola]|uniref:Vegetative incompatibility protein HET-E-1 n=1 Tax=Clonostachys byssicola TaxID=160290 RepID=A0A9N9UH09_9HYPO|nr:unnamed protein product [Clonostachys byssicola]